MLRGTSRRVEVHCWGGLGSQLFALALIYDLQLRFPRRSFVLVLHSSGVTRRAQEISSLPFAPAYEFQDDFKLVDTLTQFSSKRSIFRRFIKELLLRIGFLAEANDDSGYAHVKPWVRQIRGHYSRRLISLDFIRLLDSHLQARYGLAFKSPSAISVHYRLGDLLHLSEKSPIEPERLAKEIYRAQTIYPGTTILYSDSAQEAKVLLGSFGVNALEIPSSSSPFEVLNFAKSSEFFIGTSSKISYWVVLLRMIKNSSQFSSMPDTDKINLEPLFESGHCQSINYYS
jgi:hypothetical protein